MTKTLRQQVLTKVLQAHEAYFDVEEGHEFAGRAFPGYAEFHAHAQQHVLVKRAKLWEADTHQYVFFDTMGRLDASELSQQVHFMQTEALRKVDPVPNHMTSDVGLVIIADEVDDEAAKQIARTHFRKNYKLGLRGWSDLKLAAIDLASGRVFTNRAGRTMAPVLASCTAKVQSGQNAATTQGDQSAVAAQSGQQSRQEVGS